MRMATRLIAAGLAGFLAGCGVPTGESDRSSRTDPDAAAAGTAGCAALPDASRVSVPVDGIGLPGRLYLAPGASRHATVAWFHGFPGLPEPSPELVSALTSAGFNLLYVHYRGSWESPGTFDTHSVRQDAGAALAFLRDTDAAHSCRVDADAIVVAGDSFGSWVALQAAASDRRVPCVAGALVVDLGVLGAAADDPAARAALVEMFTAVDEDPALGFQLRGGAEGLMAELAASRETNALAATASALAARPVLLIGAEGDLLAPLALHLQPVAEALAAAGAGSVTTLTYPGGHELADAAYAGDLVHWIRNTCLAARPR